MRRLISATLLVALLLGLFAGCSTGSEPTEATTEPPQSSGLSGIEILDNFEELLTVSDMSEHYTVTRLPAVDLPDSGETYHAAVITDTLLGDMYHLSVSVDASGDATMIDLSADTSGTEYMDFSLFCFYVYLSMGLPEMDALEFLDAFGLPSNEPDRSLTVDGWDLWAFHLEDSLFFVATYTD